RRGVARLQPHAVVCRHAGFHNAEQPGKGDPVLAGSTHTGGSCVTGGRVSLVGKTGAVALDRRAATGTGNRAASLVPVLPAHPATHLAAGRRTTTLQARL